MKTIIFLIAFLFNVFLVPPVTAADKEVICDDTGCSSPSSSAIFPSIEIWYPGKSLTKSIRVVNNGADALTVTNLTSNFFNVKDLDRVINIKIVRLVDGSTLFQNSLTDFYTTGTLNLSTIGAGSSDEYFYTATMDPDAGNEYQEASSKFDLHLNFTGGSPDNDSGIGAFVSGTSTGNQPPVCNAQTPSQLQNILVSGSSSNTVSLTWNAVSPVTHYALIFTRLSDGEKYGSTNIGNVNTYTVTNLSGGESYEFEVFGVNDCAPGPAGKVIRLVIGGTVVGRPVGEDGVVLGVNTLPEPTPTETTITPSTPDILGTDDSACQEPWWKGLLKVLIIALPFIFHFTSSKKIKMRGFTLLLVLLVISLLVDKYLFCNHSYWPAFVPISYLIGEVLNRKSAIFP